MSERIIDGSKIDSFVESVLVGTFYRIFRVNVNTGEFKVCRDNGLFDEDVLNSIPDIYAYMEKLINDKIILPEYTTICRRFTNPEYIRKSVFTSEKRIVQSYKARTVKGIQWVTFTIIIAHGCSPENPEVLFTWREADSEAMTLLDTLPTISSLYDKLLRINLTNNTYEPVIVDADETEQLVGGVINMYEWWAAYSKEGNIAPEDKGAFSVLTKTGSLKEHFDEDPTPVNFRYRRKIGDEYRWVQLELAPSVEYSDDNQVMLLSLRDVHEEQTAQIRSRQNIIDNMSRDALTNLYNRLKFKSDIEKLENSDESIFTCLYIDVNGLHELNNLLGHQKGDDMLCSVADSLVKYFPDERVYRIGGDEFIVISTKLSKGEVEFFLEKVREELQRDNYAISAGFESGTCGLDMEDIVEAAEIAMRRDKEEYYKRNGDDRKKREMNEELEQMLVKKQDSERFLNVIARQFPGVYIVDLISDTLRHIHIPDFFLGLLDETDACFSAAMRLYVERFVKAEYHDQFNDVLNFDRLKQKLSENESIQFAYQKTNDVWMNCRILEIDRQQNNISETIWILEEEKY